MFQGSVLDCGRRLQRWRRHIISFLRGITIYRGYLYENKSRPPSCPQQEQKHGHHTLAHGGPGDQLLGETGKALEKRRNFNQRSFLDRRSDFRIPARGQVQRHRDVKPHLQGIPVSVAAVQVQGSGVSGGRLDEQQGLDSFSIQLTKFMQHLPRAMKGIQCHRSSGSNERKKVFALKELAFQ